MFWELIKITDISSKDLDAAYNALHPSRRAHIDCLKQERDRLCSLGGEILAKKLLKKHYGIDNAVIVRADNGRPYVMDSNIYISISHCDENVVCAVDTAPVGIDIERIRPVKEALINRVCTMEEAEYLSSAKSGEEGLYRFFEVWTAKEAYFKKQGTGITQLNSINVLNLKRQVTRMDDYLIQTVK